MMTDTLKVTCLQAKNALCWWSTIDLGALLAQAWVCVNQTCTSSAAAGGSSDMPCYVFNEKTRLFVYWANNSFLRKVLPA